MKSKDIAKTAIYKMNQTITNEIFMIIQNDKELMYEYLKSVEKNGLDNTNQTIGKEVKKAYGLENDDREENPSCTLIQSHQKFK